MCCALPATAASLHNNRSVRQHCQAASARCSRSLSAVRAHQAIGMPGQNEKEAAAEAAKDNVIDKDIKLPPTLQLIPARHTKTVHLVRHGEGYHNVAGKQGYHMYGRQEYFDAHLTEFGWQQASQLADYVDKHKIKREVDVVIVSPLSRALETAVGAFGGSEVTSGSGSVLMQSLKAEEGVAPDHAAVSSEGSPPFVAWEGCREHLGCHPCDQRRSVSHLRQQFPGVDFSLVKGEEDTLWKADERESTRDLTQRGVDFLTWLMQRPEPSIAVVSHSSFLLHMLSACGMHTEPPVQEELQSWYANCEMRTVVLSSTNGTNHPDTRHFPGYRIEHEHAAVTQGTTAMEQKQP